MHDDFSVSPTVFIRLERENIMEQDEEFAISPPYPFSLLNGV